jgi:hypothetical protein
VAFHDTGSELRQPRGDRAELQVAAADLVAQVQEDLGDAAHADPANPREVQMLPV